MLLNCGVGKDSWESLGQQEIKAVNPKGNQSWNIHWKDWCWSWSSNTLATYCEELTHWKTPWCWKGLRAGGEGDDRGWDGWMALPTQSTWVWASSGSWWWTGKTGVLQSMGLQKVRHNWVTKMNHIQTQILGQGIRRKWFKQYKASLLSSAVCKRRNTYALAFP